MPPPKKAAKKTAKKAAKKTTNKSGKHHGNKDLRRAYEHSGRLQSLSSSLSGAAVEQVQTLLRLAQSCMGDGEYKNAADLLRAGEHLAFGSLAEDKGESGASDELTDAVREQYEHLIEKIQDRGPIESTDTLGTLFGDTLAKAEAALRKGAFRRALEFARAAEALTHVELSQPKLKPGAAAKLIGKGK